MPGNRFIGTDSVWRIVSESLTVDNYKLQYTLNQRWFAMLCGWSSIHDAHCTHLQSTRRMRETGVLRFFFMLLYSHGSLSYNAVCPQVYNYVILWRECDSEWYCFARIIYKYRNPRIIATRWSFFKIYFRQHVRPYKI